MKSLRFYYYDNIEAETVLFQHVILLLLLLHEMDFFLRENEYSAKRICWSLEPTNPFQAKKLEIFGLNRANVFSNFLSKLENQILFKKSKSKILFSDWSLVKIY